MGNEYSSHIFQDFCQSQGFQWRGVVAQPLHVSSKNRKQDQQMDEYLFCVLE